MKKIYKNIHLFLNNLLEYLNKRRSTSRPGFGLFKTWLRALTIILFFSDAGRSVQGRRQDF